MDVQSDAACPLSPAMVCLSYVEKVLMKRATLRSVDDKFLSLIESDPHFSKEEFLLSYQGGSSVNLGSLNHERSSHIVLGVALMLESQFPDRVGAILNRLVDFYRRGRFLGYGELSLRFRVNDRRVKSILFHVPSMLYLSKSPASKALFQSLFNSQHEDKPHKVLQIHVNSSSSGLTVRPRSGLTSCRCQTCGVSSEALNVPVFKTLGDDESELESFMKDLPGLSFSDKGVAILLNRLFSSPQTPTVLKIVKALVDRLALTELQDIGDLLRLKCLFDEVFDDYSDDRECPEGYYLLKNAFQDGFDRADHNRQDANYLARCLMGTVKCDYSPGAVDYARNYILRAISQDPTILFPPSARSTTRLRSPSVAYLLFVDPSFQMARERFLDTATTDQIDLLGKAIETADEPLGVDLPGLRALTNPDFQRVLRGSLIKRLARELTHRNFENDPDCFSRRVSQLISLCYGWKQLPKISFCNLLDIKVGQEKSRRIFSQLNPHDALSRPRTGNYGAMEDGDDATPGAAAPLAEACPRVRPLSGELRRLFIVDFKNYEETVSSRADSSEGSRSSLFKWPFKSSSKAKAKSQVKSERKSEPKSKPTAKPKTSGSDVSVPLLSAEVLFEETVV